jgi:cation diffusion facilitator family transporter
MHDPVSRNEGAGRIRRAAWIGLIANLVLSAGKLAAGIIGHSSAVVADAVHSMSDVVTDVALVLGVRFWSAPADERHPHGHGRIETVITVGIGVVLVVVGLGLGWNAIKGVQMGHLAHTGPSAIALVAALVSIVSKEWLYRWTQAVGWKENSQALVANAWHHRSDALSSLPAALAVAVTMVKPDWVFVDDIGAIIVCHFILVAAWRIVKPALAQLVDEAAPEAERAEIERLALGVTVVLDAHALRTRFIGADLAVDLHVAVDPNLSVGEGYQIARAVREVLLEQGPKVSDVLVQIEPKR